MNETLIQILESSKKLSNELKQLYQKDLIIEKQIEDLTKKVQSYGI